MTIFQKFLVVLLYAIPTLAGLCLVVLFWLMRDLLEGGLEGFVFLLPGFVFWGALPAGLVLGSLMHGDLKKRWFFPTLAVYYASWALLVITSCQLVKPS